MITASAAARIRLTPLAVLLSLEQIYDVAAHSNSHMAVHHGDQRLLLSPSHLLCVVSIVAHRLAQASAASSALPSRRGCTLPLSAASPDCATR